jgi:hypothetical protein
MTLLRKGMLGGLILVSTLVALAISFSLKGDGPTIAGQAFAVLVAAQNKVEQDIKEDRFNADSVQRSLQDAVPSAFVYVSLSGTIFLSLEGGITIVLEPRVAKNKSVMWKCTTKAIEVRNQERVGRLRCADLNR